MELITVKAYAKINLGLDVLRRLENGYHELRMIMQTVGIYDTLTLEKTTNEGEILLFTDREGLPCDEKNLAYRAAAMMFKEYGLTGGIRITLEKRIPMAAGMAGGSADAAAVLRGINILYGLNREDEELKRLGKQLGADVPYCVVGGTCLAEGIGEKLTVLPELTGAHLLIAKPDFDVSTKFVYEHLDAGSVDVHPDIDGQLEALYKGDLKAVAEKMGNVLQDVTIPYYPQVSEIKENMLRLGAFGSMMSGSGPSVFGFFETDEEAKRAKEEMKNLFPGTAFFVTGFVNPGKEE